VQIGRSNIARACAVRGARLAERLSTVESRAPSWLVGTIFWFIDVRILEILVERLRSTVVRLPKV
jgi:hypothetical protein